MIFEGRPPTTKPEKEVTNGHFDADEATGNRPS
jgi:hypothetical protein